MGRIYFRGKTAPQPYTKYTKAPFNTSANKTDSLNYIYWILTSIYYSSILSREYKTHDYKQKHILDIFLEEDIKIVTVQFGSLEKKSKQSIGMCAINITHIVKIQLK